MVTTQTELNSSLKVNEYLIRKLNKCRDNLGALKRKPKELKQLLESKQ
jgi:hypothetical protein